MVQRWHDLLFLHWRRDPTELQATLPDGLRIDTWGGSAWLGIVPFHMSGVRLRGLPPIPGLSSFAELNVRTYVLDERGTPGVWFYSLDAEQALAVRFARFFYRLPYFHARMPLRWDTDGFLEYGCRRRGLATLRWAWYRFRRTGPERRAEPGTLEHFLVERYVLFAAHRGRLYEARVSHDPYAFCAAEVRQWSAEPLVWDGLAAARTEPDSALFSPEVSVRVGPLERLPAPGR
jgi:uncharacterized protein YqjF (DUF2071 family)